MQHFPSRKEAGSVSWWWTQPGWPAAGKDALELGPQDRQEELLQKSNILVFQLQHCQLSKHRSCCWNMNLPVKASPLFSTISQAEITRAIPLVYWQSGAFVTNPFSPNKMLSDLPPLPEKGKLWHYQVCVLQVWRQVLILISTKRILCVLVHFLVSKTDYKTVAEHMLMLFWCLDAHIWIGKSVWGLEAENAHPW